MEEVKELSASEIMGWQEYFSIYGFTEERIDIGLGKIAQAVINMAGRKLKDTLELNNFLPPYLQTSVPTTEKSLEQQRAEAEAYHAKRHALLKV